MTKSEENGGHFENCHGGHTIQIQNVQQVELGFPMLRPFKKPIWTIVT